MVVTVVMTSTGKRLLAVSVGAAGVVARLGEGIGVVAGDSGSISGVALAHLIGGGVCRQNVGVLNSVAVLLATELAEETALAGRPGGVIVGRGRAKGLLLTTVADEDKLHQGGEDEEETAKELVRLLLEYFLFWRALTLQQWKRRRLQSASDRACHR